MIEYFVASLDDATIMFPHCADERGNPPILIGTIGKHCGTEGCEGKTFHYLCASKIAQQHKNTEFLVETARCNTHDGDVVITKELCYFERSKIVQGKCAFCRSHGCGRR